MNDRLKHILYISVPENINSEITGFKVDPGKLLPVETKSAESGFSPDDLSWEMIIAGMLKVLAWQPDHEDADYYREFVKAVKPEIGQELGSAGIIKAQEKDFEIALEIFLSLSNLFPEKPEYTLNLAIAYQEQGKNYEKLEKEDISEEYFQLAHDTYLSLSDKAEGIPGFHYNFGLFYMHLKNYNKAEVHLNAYMKLENDNQEKEKIAKIIEMITERKNQDEEFLKAYDFIRLGKEKEGIDLIRKFLEKNSESWNAWFMLGWAMRRLEQYGDACASFARSLELNNSNTDTYNELAICCMELAKYKESSDYLEKALQMEPENLKIISNFGILSLKQKKMKEAEGFFNTVLEFDPDDPIALEYIEFLKNQ